MTNNDFMVNNEEATNMVNEATAWGFDSKSFLIGVATVAIAEALGVAGRHCVHKLRDKIKTKKQQAEANKEEPEHVTAEVID